MMETRTAARLMRWAACLGVLFAWNSRAHAGMIDLTRAAVAPAELSAVEQQAAATMSISRSPTNSNHLGAHQLLSCKEFGIGLGTAAALKQAGVAFADHEPGAAGLEGFHLRVHAREKAPWVVLEGNDSRGVLFGVGRLLRELRMTKQKVELSDDLDIRTSPQSRLRGHQLGYRPKPILMMPGTCPRGNNTSAT